MLRVEHRLISLLRRGVVSEAGANMGLVHRKLTRATAQRNGAKNDAEVVRLTDECAAKGIVLVPGGENL